jgi:hypothetical protein
LVCYQSIPADDVQHREQFCEIHSFGAFGGKAHELSNVAPLPRALLETATSQIAPTGFDPTPFHFLIANQCEGIVDTFVQ